MPPVARKRRAQDHNFFDQIWNSLICLVLKPMLKHYLLIAASSLLVAACVSRSSQAANQEGALSVYFVSVGSSDYIQPDKPSETPFADIDGANKSARIVARFLSQGGARNGILLTSAPGHFVSLEDINAAVTATQTQLKGDSSNPFFVFYIASHGISDGIAWNHFSIPGDFLYMGDVNKLDVERLSDKTLYAGSLADQLDKAKVPYLVILDTCYSGKPAIFESPVLGQRAMQGIEDTAAALKVINEFHQPSPVLFSTEPGTTVETVPDPENPSSNRVAPLARRMILVLGQASKSGRTLTLGSFLEALSAPNLDATTKPPVTFAERAPFWQEALFSFGGNPSPPAETRIGTASAPEICCENAASSALPNQNLEGTVDFSGPAGEYVTDGGTFHIVSPGTPISMVQNGPGDIDITIGSQDNSWELGLSTPNSQRFSEQHYIQAGRYPFAAPGQAGLALTGAGRACNQIKGDFTVTEVAYDTAGKLVHIAAQFRQRCDDESLALTGTLNLK
jgi:hypothetical protein